MSESTALGQFLQARRGRVQPESVGIGAFGRRRVSGLRREELAALAGVSVDYYVRLEQGRASNPSEQVLDAIARVLALDHTERVHMHRLARRAEQRGRARQAAEVVRPGMAGLLAGLASVPAYLLGRRLDVLAWTRLGGALVASFPASPARQRNLARMVFFDPAARELLPDWDDVACETVGLLRLVAGRNPDDAEVAELVDELSVKADDFRRMWADHEVAEMTSGTRRFHHPIVGDLTLSFEALAVPDESSQMLIIYTAEPGGPDAAALDLLAAHIAQPA